MRTQPIFSAFLLAIVLFTTQCTTAQYRGNDDYGRQSRWDNGQQSRWNNNDDFYNDLAPYGEWFNYGNYGRVWRPRVEAGFQPYATNGRWEMTEYGMTWVSGYPWGWAAFHYGRWIYDDYYNSWIWIPDNEWGPAWVTWRSGGGYYGWAPLGYGMGVDININIRIPYSHWVFVPDVYIGNSRWYDYRLPYNRFGNVWGNTVIVNNYYRYNNRMYASGPHRHEIDRISRNRMSVRRSEDVIREERGRRSNNNDRDMGRSNNRNYDNNRNSDNARGQRTEQNRNNVPQDNVRGRQRTYETPSQPEALPNNRSQQPSNSGANDWQQRRRGNTELAAPADNGSNRRSAETPAPQRQPAFERSGGRERTQEAPQQQQRSSESSSERGGRRRGGNEG